MGIFMLWIILCALVSLTGMNKSIGYWGVFLFAFFLSPLIGLIVGLASSDEKVYRCMSCGYKDNKYSKFCPNCGRG